MFFVDPLYSYHLSCKVERVELKYTKKKKEPKIRSVSHFCRNVFKQAQTNDRASKEGNKEASKQTKPNQTKQTNKDEMLCLRTAHNTISVSKVQNTSLTPFENSLAVYTLSSLDE